MWRCAERPLRRANTSAKIFPLTSSHRRRSLGPMEVNSLGPMEVRPSVRRSPTLVDPAACGHAEELDISSATLLSVGGEGDTEGAAGGEAEEATSFASSTSGAAEANTEGANAEGGHAAATEVVAEKERAAVKAKRDVEEKAKEGQGESHVPSMSYSSPKVLPGAGVSYEISPTQRVSFGALDSVDESCSKASLRRESAPSESCAATASLGVGFRWSAASTD